VGGLLKSLPNVVGFNHNIWPSVLVLVFIVALDLCEAPHPTSKAV
jgi:predicted cobalt transporter CbtA